MTNSFRPKYCIWLLAICVLFAACGGGDSSDSGKKGAAKAVDSKKAGDNTVTIHEPAEPDFLNPMISGSASSTYIETKIFQALLTIDFETLEPVGQLAVGRPEIKELDSGPFKGGMSLTYEIRPEAKWDNGTPITASDYIFSLKAIKNPKVNAGSLRPYMEAFTKVEVDPNNPKKFTVFAKETYILAEIFSATTVYPEYVYDPEGLMKKFTLEELSDPKNANKLADDKNLQKFAEQFNSPKFSREVGYVVGSGPYAFKGWETGQRITLEKKKDWWAKDLNLPMLQAYPDKVIHKIVNDRTTAVTSMKDEGLDVVRDILPNLFVDLKKNDRVNQLFNLHTPTALVYYYIGINRKSPKLADQKVRRAIAHLVDVEEIIDVILHGLGERTVGPIHPSKSYYNKSLTPIPFDVAKAKQLLTEAGWKDSDGDGIVDKVVDGQKVDMSLSYKYNSDNDMRKDIGLLLKENAKRAGVNIEVEGVEWTVFLEDTKKRDYELSSLAWVASPIPEDPKQIWHTESDNPDGDNRVGFGNEESDKIIEDIRVTLDEGKRAELYKRYQEIVYEDQPYVFMFASKERIAIHSRFDAAKAYVARPGYNEMSFKLKP